MKKIISILVLVFLNMPNIFSYQEEYGPINEIERQVLTFGDNTCENIEDSDIPTIFVPGILASWYSEEGLNENNVKKWTPDPVTYAYDTLFKVFQDNGYTLHDVYYKNEFETYIKGNPKSGFYLFGYDWKKDNKITAKLLSNLILNIRGEYKKQNGCDIGTVNIVAHSMGGLVARAMLEDMCASNEELEDYYKNTEKGKIKYISSNRCNNFTRVNNFITIATPHRGSPGGFPIWSKGDISQTEAFLKANVLKGQLGVKTNKGLYELIHGYDKKVKNGIITIGQLLPDIGNYGNYNRKLLYLEKDGEKLSKNRHPQNSFLEELNKKDNIEKMFSNISGKFTLYYSNTTGNLDKNNIIGFELLEKYSTGLYGFTLPDRTEKHKGSDIYDKYRKDVYKNIYNISSNIRNNKGLGGDGTVPSRNSRLIVNDLYNPTEIKDSKFKSIEIDCIDIEKGLDKDTGDYIEKDLVFKLGKTNMEFCSHTKLPTISSIKIFEKISGIKLINSSEEKEQLKEERKILYKYLGNTDRISNKLKLRKNNSESLFKNYYSYLFNTDDKLTQDEKIDNFILNRTDKDYKRLDTSVSLGLNEVLRYEILSPINIIIEDELGRKIGIDPNSGIIINEIPGAWTSGNTEGTNQPEFFLIPKTGTGKVLHKITSYPTGEGEYHIVMDRINDTSISILSSLDEKSSSMIIAGIAKEGVIENYMVGIEENKTGYIKINKTNSYILNDFDLDIKYKVILSKIIKIIEKKYSLEEKKSLRLKLLKLKDAGFGSFSDNEKVVYLVGKIIDYLR